MNDRLERNKTTVTTFYDLTFNQCGCRSSVGRLLDLQREGFSNPWLAVLDGGAAFIPARVVVNEAR